MSTETTTPDPPGTAHPSEVWVLQAVFGASILALIAFWILMLFRVPQGAAAPGIEACRVHQVTVEAALRLFVAGEDATLREVLGRYGRGATIGPLFDEMLEKGLLPDPPPHTPECRSWKDYTLVDPQNPSFESLSCRVHGGRPRPPEGQASP